MDVIDLNETYTDEGSKDVWHLHCSCDGRLGAQCPVCCPIVVTWRVERRVLRDGVLSWVRVGDQNYTTENDALAAEAAAGPRAGSDIRIVQLENTLTVVRFIRGRADDSQTQAREDVESDIVESFGVYQEGDELAELTLMRGDHIALGFEAADEDAGGKIVAGRVSWNLEQARQVMAALGHLLWVAEQNAAEE